jgi:hypothetical protein
MRQERGVEVREGGRCVTAKTTEREVRLVMPHAKVPYLL